MERCEVRERSEFAPLQQGEWDKCPVKRKALKGKGSLWARRGVCRHTECTWLLFFRYNKKDSGKSNLEEKSIYDSRVTESITARNAHQEAGTAGQQRQEAV